VLQPHLQWEAHGPKCTVNTLLLVLFFAACSRLRDAPSDQAVCNALAALTSVRREMEVRTSAYGLSD
jgi:hypothetical protein